MADHWETWVTVSINLSHNMPIGFYVVCHEPLEVTPSTLFHAVTMFKFSQNNVWVAPSSNCISQHPVVSTLQYLISYTWHVVIVQSFKHLTWSKHDPQIFHAPSNMHMFHQLHSTPKKVHYYFKDKNLVFGLPRDPTPMDKLETRVVFKCHDTIHSTHPTSHEMLCPIYKVTTFRQC